MAREVRFRTRWADARGGLLAAYPAQATGADTDGVVLALERRAGAERRHTDRRRDRTRCLSCRRKVTRRRGERRNSGVDRRY